MSEPKNMDLKVGVVFLETGTTRIRPTMRTQSATRSVLLRRLRFLTDRTWTEPLPIGCFLIHHPEGPFLFDTGESPYCNRPGYFPFWMPTVRLATDISIGAKQGVDSLLREEGVDPADVKAVILSHLHHDHAGGLEVLPQLPVYVTNQHWDVFKRRLHATIEGCAPKHWPQSFNPRLLELKDNPVGPWERTYPITSDGRVIGVDTPGHVPGHLSLVVFGDDATYFLTGDATYGIDLLDQELTDGINDDPLTALKSVRMIKEFARRSPVVVLPAHDVNTRQILAMNKVYQPRRL